MNTKFNSVKTTSINVKNIKDVVSMKLYNRSFTLAQSGKSCVVCGKQAESFSCERAAIEFKVSAMCEPCQNEVFEPIDG
jgi:hypothetical protein